MQKLIEHHHGYDTDHMDKNEHRGRYHHRCVQMAICDKGVTRVATNTDKDVKESTDTGVGW